MLEEIKKTAGKIQFFSIFTPGTFYKSVNNELSSFGFKGFADIYNRSIKRYEEFVQYFIENRASVIRPIKNPFIKNTDDYLFNLKSNLPDYFVFGILFNLFIFLVLLWVSYFCFKRIIFPVTRNAAGFKEVDLKLSGGKHMVYACAESDHDFPAQLFNALSGKRKYPGKISINDKELVSGERQNFFYLPMAGLLQINIKTGKLINLFSDSIEINKKEMAAIKEQFAPLLSKRFSEISDADKIMILVKLALIKKYKIYLLEDLFYGILVDNKEEYCKNIFDRLREQDTIIVEITAITGPRHSHFYLYTGFSLNNDNSYHETILGDKTEGYR